MLNELETEQVNPKTTNLDELSIREILRIMNEEDAIVPLAVRGALPQIERIVELCISSLKKGGRVFYVGAGTSGRLAVLDAVEVVPTFGVPDGVFVPVMAGGAEALTRALEHVEDSEEAGARDIGIFEPTRNDVVIGISASGRTPYVRGALKRAKKLGARTAIICNVSNTPMAQFVDVVVSVRTGPEVITGSTRLKAGTGQKLVLNMISTAAMVKLGRALGNHMVCVKATNKKLSQRAARIISQKAGITMEKAFKFLEDANYDTGLAVLMALTGMEKNQCEAVLREMGGNLREALKLLKER